MVWEDLPPLGTLVAFEATIRTGSLTRAGAELHLTHGAVSRQIQQLERSLGVALFERRHRALVPTPAALTLVATVTDALGLLGSAARQVRRSRQSAPLVLSCEPTLLMRWLIPRLPSLAQAAPQLDIHFAAAGGRVRFGQDGTDVGIRRNDADQSPDAHVTPLFAERIGPVCAPELARGLVDHAALAGLTRLHTRTRMSAWAEWAQRQDAALPPAPERTFEHFYLSLEAATAGMGVAIGPLALVRDAVADGRLVAPFGFVPDGSAYVLLTDHPVGADPRVAALHAWLRAQVEEFGATTALG